MRFYKQQHQFYCGVDLHAKTMHDYLVNQAGETSDTEPRPQSSTQGYSPIDRCTQRSSPGYPQKRRGHVFACTQITHT